MTPEVLLHMLEEVGCRVIPDGDKLRVRDPQHALTDDLRKAIRHHKDDLITWLVDKVSANRSNEHPPFVPGERPGRVGRHSTPCRHCGETWRWPTDKGGEVCPNCYVASLSTTPKTEG